MNRLGAGLVGLVAGAGIVLAGVLLGNDRSAVVDALKAERDSVRTEAAELDERNTVLAGQVDALKDSLDDAIAVALDSAEAAQGRSAATLASARQMAAELRSTLERRHRAQFDSLVFAYEVALQDERAASTALRSALRDAETKAMAEYGLRVRETERADLWRDAYRRAVAVSDELERADFELFGLKLDIGCKAGATAAWDLGDREPVLAPGVTCGVG